MKRFASIILSLLLVIQLVPATLALEESIPQVSTLAELKAAIERAEDGDTIQITQTIQVMGYDQIGTPDKTVTLCGTESTGTLLDFIIGDENNSTLVVNLIIDGQGCQDGSKVEVGAMSNVVFDKVTWMNCKNFEDRGEGGGLNISNSKAELTNCVIKGCQAKCGGAVYVSMSGHCKLTDCSFTGNFAQSDGGALSLVGESEIKGCNFIENESDYGGAVYGRPLVIQGSKFIGNSAISGGAVLCFGDALQISDCIFQRNSAEQNAGAIKVENAENAIFTNNLVMGNHTEGVGGGLCLQTAATLRDNKILGNSANQSGADLICTKAVTIYVEDYASLYQEELTSSGNDTMAWYVDMDGNRYSAENMTESYAAALYTGEENPLELETAYLVFIMWDSTPTPDEGGDQDPEDQTPENQTPENQTPEDQTPEDQTPEDQAPEDQTPEDQTPENQTPENQAPENPRPTPQPPSWNIGWSRPDDSNDDSPSSQPTKKQETETQPSEAQGAFSLARGEAVVDQQAFTDYISELRKSAQNEREITRGEMAAILYKLLTSESRNTLSANAGNYYHDLAGVQYGDEINALSKAGVFCGKPGGEFDPLGTLTFGQLLTVLTRFVEAKGAPMSSLANSQHWAASSARIAHAYGWIGDFPIDLDAPTTYGALLSVLAQIVPQ